MPIKFSKFFLWQVLECHINHILNDINDINTKNYLIRKIWVNHNRNKLTSFIEQTIKLNIKKQNFIKEIKLQVYVQLLYILYIFTHTRIYIHICMCSISWWFMHVLCYKNLFPCIWNNALFYVGSYQTSGNKNFIAPYADTFYLSLLVSFRFPSKSHIST